MCRDRALDFVRRDDTYSFQYALERVGACRQVLLSHSPTVTCSFDIMSWMPPDLDRTALLALSFDDLRTRLLDPSIRLGYDSDGGKYVFGELHAAGPPCVDYSSMGRQQREQGPTRVIVLLWTRAIRDQRPLVVLFENVTRFPVGLLRSLLGDFYELSYAILDSVCTGGPGHRRRL